MPARTLWYPPVYKFINRKHLTAFVRRGRLKIGTSEEYRVPDGMDAGRSDPDELVRKWNPGPGDIQLSANHPFLAGLSGGAATPDRSDGVTFRFEQGAILSVALNVYIFSTSRMYTDELASKMAEIFNADCCVEIREPVKFMRLISQHDPFNKAPAGLGEVTYHSSNEFKEFDWNNPFKKLEKFEWQKEFRLFWSNDALAKGQIIDVPEIVSLLRIVSA